MIVLPSRIVQAKAGRIAAAIDEKLATAVKNTAAILRCLIISSSVISSSPLNFTRDDLPWETEIVPHSENRSADLVMVI
jgi:hypothetical protein